MAFPTSIPSNTDPASNNTLNSPSHSQLHQSHDAEVVAIETKIGTGASTPTASKLFRGTGTGTSSWGQLVLSTDVATATSADLRGVLSDETGTGAAVFGTSPTIVTPALTTGGTWTGSPTLTTPTIADLTNVQHTHANTAGGGLLNGANAITDGTLSPAELVTGTGSTWAWTLFTPTWTNLTVGNATQNFYYIQTGKTVSFAGQIILGTTSSVSSSPSFSLPVSMNTTLYVLSGSIRTNIGQSRMIAGATETGGEVVIDNTSGTNKGRILYFNATATPTAPTSTLPGTWATGNYISVSGSYQAA